MRKIVNSKWKNIFSPLFLPNWEDGFWWARLENSTHPLFHPPSFTTPNEGKLSFSILPLFHPTKWTVRVFLGTLSIKITYKKGSFCFLSLAIVAAGQALTNYFPLLLYPISLSSSITMNAWSVILVATCYVVIVVPRPIISSALIHL